jgi:hypothetical protein
LGDHTQGRDHVVEEVIDVVGKIGRDLLQPLLDLVLLFGGVALDQQAGKSQGRDDETGAEDQEPGGQPPTSHPLRRGQGCRRSANGNDRVSWRIPAFVAILSLQERSLADDAPHNSPTGGSRQRRLGRQ